VVRAAGVEPTPVVLVLSTAMLSLMLQVTG
jgi:hypothetical protein